MNKGAPLSLARLISEIEKHAPGPQAALDRAIARGENLTLVFPLFTHWLLSDVCKDMGGAEIDYLYQLTATLQTIPNDLWLKAIGIVGAHGSYRWRGLADKVIEIMGEYKLQGPTACAFCDKKANGRHLIPSEPSGKGPDLVLCSACMGSASVTLKVVWQRVADKRVNK